MGAAEEAEVELEGTMTGEAEGAPAPVASPYFKNEEGLIQEFEFDYEKLNAFDVELAWRYSLLGLCWSVPCFFLCAKDNIVDANNAKHVAVTQDGIRYSVDHHSAGCRCECMEEGRVTKTIPFDKITDCDVEEPGGASGPLCCMLNNVLTQVNVDTASSGKVGPDGMQHHELVLRGLKDPFAFKKLVWQVKREGGDRAVPLAGAAPSGLSVGGKAPSSESMSRNDIAPILERQNEILAEQTDLLRQLVAKS